MEDDDPLPPSQEEPSIVDVVLDWTIGVVTVVSFAAFVVLNILIWLRF
jgi:hypothetical protein